MSANQFESHTCLDPRVDHALQNFADRSDLREQLVNGGETGPIAEVSVGEAMVTSLRGILFDIDPLLLHDDLLPDGGMHDPGTLYSDLVRSWLSQNPVLSKAEVRSSGRGLHVLLRFLPHVEFASEAERSRWATIVKTVQHILPTDPNAPGITALTRPLGSINSKNGAEVRVLYLGEPVSENEVLDLFGTLKTKPFRVVCATLFGSERIQPCPKCRKAGSSLVAYDRGGKCYGCGQVKLGDIYDRFFATPSAQRQGDADE